MRMEIMLKKPFCELQSIESDIKRLACYDYLTTGISKTSKEIEKKDEQVSNNSVPNIISEKDANFGLSNKQKKEADIKVIKSQLTSTIHVLFIFFNFVWSYF